MYILGELELFGKRTLEDAKPFVQDIFSQSHGRWSNTCVSRLIVLL